MIVIPTKKDRIIKNLESDLAFMLFDSMNDKAKISNMEHEIGQLVMEISNIKKEVTK